MNDGVHVVGVDGTTTVNKIDCGDSTECNQFRSADTYSTCITGYLHAPSQGTYDFSIDSDDATDFYLNTTSTDFRYCDDPKIANRVSYWYGDHQDAHDWTDDEANRQNGQIELEEGYYPFVLRHNDDGGVDVFKLGWKKPSDASFSIVPSNRFRREDTSARSLVGTASSVTNDTRASASWSVTCNSDYLWKAVADDGDASLESVIWSFNTTICNNPPSASLENPSPDGTSTNNDPETLEVQVSDADASDNQLNVWFYNADNGNLIGTDMNVNDGNSASVQWSTGTVGTYNWYVNVSDGKTNFTNMNSPWSFQYTTGALVSCPAGWISFNGHCYTETPSSGGYSYGESYCDSESAYITTVNDNSEQGFLANNFITDGIGLRDENGDGVYADNEWHGPDSSYRSWGPSGANTGGDCVFLKNAFGGDWKATSCSTSRKWVCEKSPVPGYRFRVDFDHRYTSLTSSIDNPSYIRIEVESTDYKYQDMRLDISGVNAEFVDGGGTTKTFSIPGQGTKRFQVEVDPATAGTHVLEATATNTNFDVSKKVEIPVSAREFPATASNAEVPGIGYLQLLFVVLVSTLLFASSL